MAGFFCAHNLSVLSNTMNLAKVGFLTIIGSNDSVLGLRVLTFRIDDQIRSSAYPLDDYWAHPMFKLSVWKLMGK